MQFYKKNNLEFQRKEGWIYSKIEGKIIDKKSTLYNISFEDDPFRNIYIKGDLFIKQGGYILNYLEMNIDVIDYYCELIRGKRLNYMRFMMNGNIELSIETDFILIIFIDIEMSPGFGEQWVYNYKNGSLIM